MTESGDHFLVELVAKSLTASTTRLTTAESCTGGGIAQMLTSIPGSSVWFERGFVTYSNDAKMECLGVPRITLDEYGAVSEETAAAMARGALEHSHADVSISVTGIAGPDGGTEDKPVGTVCLGWSKRDGETLTTRVLFEGNRQQVRQQSALMALQGLLDFTEQS
jgi:nicotinamide-nucleotide amidase